MSKKSTPLVQALDLAEEYKKRLDSLLHAIQFNILCQGCSGDCERNFGYVWVVDKSNKIEGGYWDDCLDCDGTGYDFKIKG